MHYFFHFKSSFNFPLNKHLSRCPLLICDIIYYVSIFISHVLIIQIDVQNTSCINIFSPFYRLTLAVSTTPPVGFSMILSVVGMCYVNMYILHKVYVYILCFFLIQKLFTIHWLRRLCEGRGKFVFATCHWLNFSSFSLIENRFLIFLLLLFDFSYVTFQLLSHFSLALSDQLERFCLNS